MKRLSLLVSLGACIMAAAVPRIGDRPPAILLDKVFPMQPIANANWKALAGKTVVLEFWATWCGPCVEAIPHLNELAAKFKDQPVVFLSVSDEDPEQVEYFLKKHPIDGLVGVAHTHSALDDYGLKGIPGTFLINASGRIAGILDPITLQAPMIEAVMANRDLPPPDRSQLRTVTLPPSTIIRQHVNEPNSPIFKPPFENFNGPFGMEKLNSRMMSWYTLRSIVQRIWNFPFMRRLEGDALADPFTYDVYLANPGVEPEVFPAWERAVIEAAFRIKVTRETREEDVWVLSKLDAKPESLKPPGTIKDFSNNGKPGHILIPRGPVSFIAQMLESAAGKPIVDETGIGGDYDFELAWTGANEIRSIEALRNAGFKVEPARRSIEHLIVTKLP